MATPIPQRKRSTTKQPNGRPGIKTVSVSSTMPPSANVCRSCHALPMGSADLTALLLVLIFSLTAVLFTTTYALDIEQQKNANLEAALEEEFAVYTE